MAILRQRTDEVRVSNSQAAAVKPIVPPRRRSSKTFKIAPQLRNDTNEAVPSKEEPSLNKRNCRLPVGVYITAVFIGGVLLFVMMCAIVMAIL